MQKKGKFSFKKCFGQNPTHLCEPSPKQKLNNLTASDPHAGVVPLQRLPHHCEGLGLHLHQTVFPHQSLHGVCILDDLIYGAVHMGYLLHVSSSTVLE